MDGITELRVTLVLASLLSSTALLTACGGSAQGVTPQGWKVTVTASGASVDAKASVSGPATVNPCFALAIRDGRGQEVSGLDREGCGLGGAIDVPSGTTQDLFTEEVLTTPLPSGTCTAVLTIDGGSASATTVSVPFDV